MQRDLLTKLYDGVVGIAGDYAIPSASSRRRYAMIAEKGDYQWIR